jgi:hypothetical protein
LHKTNGDKQDYLRYSSNIIKEAKTRKVKDMKIEQARRAAAQ